MTDEPRTDGGEQDSPADALPVADVTGAALGALSAAEDAAVRDAIASNAPAAAELAGMEAVVADLAWLVPQRQMNRGRSAGIRSRLVSRAASGEGPPATPRPEAEGVRVPPTPQAPQSGRAQPASPRAAGTVPLSGMPHPMPHPTARPVPPVYRRSFNWLALVAGIAFVVTAGALVRVIHDLQDQTRFREAVAAEQQSMAQKVASLQSSMATKDSLIASLTGPQMKVVDLVNYSSQDPLARMFWDQKTQEWTMYAYHMRQPRAGKTFQVWLITNTSSKPISAGTFIPDANGSAVMHAKYPMDKGALQKVAISEEPVGGMPYPTGPILIAGRGR